MFKGTDYLRRIIAPVGGQGVECTKEARKVRSCSRALITCGASSHQLEDRVESQCPTFASTATVSLWKTTFGGSLGDRPQSGCAQFVEKSTIGSNRTGFKSCEQGYSFEQAKVFKAYAAPQGLCANLINALKLLANQQEDGDGLLQS